MRQLVSQKGVRLKLVRSREELDGTVVELLGGLDYVRAANTQDLELDRVASRIAAQLKGAVSSKRSLEVAGLDARSYTVAFARKTEEITFALDGQREYQLLCRRAAGAGDGPCVELLATFALR